MDFLHQGAGKDWQIEDLVLYGMRAEPTDVVYALATRTRLAIVVYSSDKESFAEVEKFSAVVAGRVQANGFIRFSFMPDDSKPSVRDIQMKVRVPGIRLVDQVGGFVHRGATKLIFEDVALPVAPMQREFMATIAEFGREIAAIRE